jgi:SAM-dependent methyltransferase
VTSSRQPSTGLVFEQVADLYDEVRPSYPAALYADLTELSGIGPGSRLLEVGSGTGKATAAMAGQGYQIVCLEPGASMAAVAQAKLAPLAGIEVVNATFEAWEPGRARFDLIFAATSWHWVDPAVRYRKAASLLGPGGALAVWAACHAFPAGFDPFFTEIQLVYDALTGPSAMPWPPPQPPDVPDLTAEIEASGCFGDIAIRRYLWEHRYTAEQYVSLLDTFSSHLTMDRSARDALYAEVRERIARRPGGSVTRHWLVILHVARGLAAGHGGGELDAPMRSRPGEPYRVPAAVRCDADRESGGVRLDHHAVADHQADVAG